jgi:hypothetical protein
MKFKRDYAAAGVPMLPVVAKDTKVAREMILYTLAMIVCSLLIWPVQGPVTSPFGWRWGRMHEGIDISVPEGTPIRAAAASSIFLQSVCDWRWAKLNS